MKWLSIPPLFKKSTAQASDLDAADQAANQAAAAARANELMQEMAHYEHRMLTPEEAAVERYRRHLRKRAYGAGAVTTVFTGRMVASIVCNDGCPQKSGSKDGKEDKEEGGGGEGRWG